jgi:hypothetical protein
VVILAAPWNNQMEINIRDQKTRTSADLVKIFLHFFALKIRLDLKISGNPIETSYGIAENRKLIVCKYIPCFHINTHKIQ